MKKSLATDLTQGNVLRQLIAFAIPIALANILQIVYTVVDTVIVGRFIGTDGIAGVSSASNIIMLCTNFSMGISGAGQVRFAQFQGKNDGDAVSRSIGTMFTFTLLVALVLTAVFLPLTRPLLRLIRTPEAAFSMAVSYAGCSFAGLLFVFGYSAVGSMLRGMGDSRHPLFFIGIATVLNIILDLLFVGPLHMGTFGAALATIIGQGLSFLFSLGYLYRKRTAFGFDFRPASFGWIRRF
jgi:Na+-driven multidrug efflux pump